MRRFGVELDMGGERGPRNLPLPCARAYEAGGDVGSGPGTGAVAGAGEGEGSLGCGVSEGEGTMYCDDGRMDNPERGDGGSPGERGTVKYGDVDRRPTEGTLGNSFPSRDGCGLGGLVARDRNECGRLMIIRLVAVAEEVDIRLGLRETDEPACPSTTMESSSRPPNVRADAKDCRGAERHGSFRDPSPGERTMRRLDWRDIAAERAMRELAL